MSNLSSHMCLFEDSLKIPWDFPGSPVVKNLPSNPWGMRSIPFWGAKKNQNVKQKQYYNKVNKDFKNGPLKKKKGSLMGTSVLLCLPNYSNQNFGHDSRNQSIQPDYRSLSNCKKKKRFLGVLNPL